MQNEGQKSDGQSLSSEEMYGIAKKWTRELEQLPLHTHGAVIQLLNIAFEHRNVGMKRDEALRQQRLQEQHVDNQRRMIELQEKQRQEQEARNLMNANAPAQPQ